MEGEREGGRGERREGERERGGGWKGGREREKFHEGCIVQLSLTS